MKWNSGESDGSIKVVPAMVYGFKGKRGPLVIKRPGVVVTQIGDMMIVAESVAKDSARARCGHPKYLGRKDGKCLGCGQRL